MNILLVDDVQMERIQLAIRLKQLGHTVEMASSGQEALDMYPKFEPDLVLLDISMPEMNGFEVSAKIRELYPDWVPIIFLSSHDEPTMIASAIDAGGDDYLIKPVDKIVLNSKLIAMQRIAFMRRELKQKSAALAKANEELAQLAQEDGLTKVKNRRYIDEKLTEMISLHGRHKLPLSLILLDVDRFKLYNDNYGHIEGDRCLIEIASTLANLFTRSGEIVGRYGGEEFVVLLGHTDQEKAIKNAERIKSSIEAANLQHEYSDVSSLVTVSQGVYHLIPNGRETIEQLYELVDKRLYQAKVNGRNQYVASDD
ncbi:diguanylate cyclase [Vibrio europaeus]|nr:diguanylate cyclase [Vibrio europaeus]MDC5704922.1 diguanylate cyclase [Vibrio europaeus]MDC5710201.1 diguanylate cyclase [Vibrio europaeus]MDC5715291.1 diguanylate cyclase [Vibrio europaeus]MDC5719452.1 diguanylate cyclase [Vibrio europaeus]MDC5724660.1 diguanylate cyclase [Vibrio europaeus]